MKAVCAGVHAIAANHQKAGPLKSIPRLSCLAIGMMVKVTTNYIPELGIFNNARGTVVDIIYEHGYDPEASDVHPVVVVNLPDYTGPPMSAEFGLNGRGKWIAFTAVTKICDCFSCSRVGLPVVCAKADSIHSLQGLTVGPEKGIKRLLIHWSSKAEGLWPGIFYVGTSRAQDSGDVAVAFDVTSELLSCIGKSKGWQELHDEVCRLELKAREFRELMKGRHVAEGTQWGSARDLAERVKWMIDTIGPKTAANMSIPATNKSAISQCLDQWNKSLITAETNGWLSPSVTSAPPRVPGNTSASGSNTNSTGRTGSISSSSTSSSKSNSSNSRRSSSSSTSSRRVVSFAPAHVSPWVPDGEDLRVAALFRVSADRVRALAGPVSSHVNALHASSRGY
ncbi:MAG: hypothetical protein JW384_02636 [Nitrosomonadaceae bacterium]|nr:hypothetical protein [Nitrosomonadaceae bacterium]